MKKLSFILFALFLVLTLVACKNDKEDAPKLKDGTYTAEAEDEGHGYEKGIVVIENGKIKSIDLKRMNSDGSEVDYEQWDGNDESGRPNLKEYRLAIANEILEKQSTKGVDTITGATRSTSNWISIVIDCLEQARE